MIWHTTGAAGYRDPPRPAVDFGEQVRVTNFPIALGRLLETYDAHLWQIDSNGKGLVIFATSAGPSDAEGA